MELIRYEAARVALSECQRVDEVKDIRDKSLAMEAYARQAKDTGLMQMAAEIKVRAERRLGEMLREQKAAGGMSQGGRPSETCREERQVSPSLSDIGISRDLSSRSQQLAAMPADHFETAIASAKETARAVSTTYMLRLGEELKKTADLRADIKRTQRKNYLKYVAAALADALHWLRVGEKTNQQVFDDQIADVLRKVDQINQLAAETFLRVATARPPGAPGKQPYHSGGVEARQ